MTQKPKDDLLVKLLGFISYKPRTESEIKTRISEYCKGDSLISDNCTELEGTLIQELRDMNLLNDKAYCERYLEEQLHSTKPKSVAQMKLFLYKKGVPNSIVGEVLGSYSTEGEIASIRKYITKNSSRTQQQLINYLLRKGYQYNNIIVALNTDLTINSN